MAVKKNNDPLTLTPEMKTRLTDLQADIDRAQKAITVLNSLGMDTTALSERLSWSDTVRKTLLKEFGGV